MTKEEKERAKREAWTAYKVAVEPTRVAYEAAKAKARAAYDKAWNTARAAYQARMKEIEEA